MDQQIVVYKPSEKIRMEVKTDGERVWLTQEQMCQLYCRERRRGRYVCTRFA